MGNTSVKGLKLMESIYPSDDQRSVFDSNPKLKAKLDREYAKGTIRMAPTDEEEPIDGDMNLLVSRELDEVWAAYDPKGAGSLDKKAMEKFLKDALMVHALRNGYKSDKEVVARGVNANDAMKNTISMIAKRGTGRADRREFDDFIQTYDIEEALGHFLGKNTGVVIDITKVATVDVTQFQAQQTETIKPVYRDYPDD